MAKLKKLQYQIEAVRLMERYKGRVLLADEMGLGKSIESLLWAKRHPKLRPIIVICPATLKWVWKSFANQILNTRCDVLNGTSPPKSNWAYNHSFLIINYDILPYWKEHLKKLKPKVLFVDECHYIKNHKAKRTKAVKSLAKDIPYIIAISGTPLTNRPAELWNTLRLVRPDLFNDKLTFTIRYCNRKWTPWGWDISGASHLEELHKNLKATMMIRRLKKDVLKELPDKIRITVPFEIERAEYDEAVNNFLMWLSKKSIAKANRASNAQQLVKMGYLKRLAAHLKMKSVISWVDNFLKESDGKLVLFAIHKSIIKTLHNKYKNISVIIDGKTPNIHRKKIVRSFQTNPHIRIFIGNIKAAGVGITLTAADSLAFVELDFVPGNHTQAEDRIHRIGQKKATNIYYLIAKDSIEESLCKILQKKQKIINSTLDGDKKKSQLTTFNELKKVFITSKRNKK